MPKIGNLKTKIGNLKAKVIEKIDKKVDPYRKEREQAIINLNKKIERYGSAFEDYSVERFKNYRAEFVKFNSFFKQGSTSDFKLVDPKATKTPSQILAGYGFLGSGENINAIEYKIKEILKNDKNKRSKIVQLNGLKEEIKGYEKHKQNFISKLKEETVRLTEIIISLEMSYQEANNEILKFDPKVKENIKKEIDAWKRKLLELRNYVKILTDNSPDIYFKKIDHTINRLEKTK